jgi:hypothetical protein
MQIMVLDGPIAGWDLRLFTVLFVHSQITPLAFWATTWSRCFPDCQMSHEGDTLVWT